MWTIPSKISFVSGLLSCARGHAFSPVFLSCTPSFQSPKSKNDLQCITHALADFHMTVYGPMISRRRAETSQHKHKPAAPETPRPTSSPLVEAACALHSQASVPIKFDSGNNEELGNTQPSRVGCAFHAFLKKDLSFLEDHLHDLLGPGLFLGEMEFFNIDHLRPW